MRAWLALAAALVVSPAVAAAPSSVKIGGTVVKWSAEPHIERRLIYLGGRPQEAKFGYREFTHGTTRPTVSEDVGVSLYNLPTVVSVKDQHIRIIRADGEGITFEIMP